MVYKMIKIIFVTREGYRLPGARIRCYNFAQELKKYGAETEVLSYSDGLGAQDGEKEARMGLFEKIKFNYKAFRMLTKDKKSIICMQRFNYHSLAPYLTHLLNRNRMILDLDDWEMRDNPEYHLGFYPSSKAHYFIRQIAQSSIFCIAASRFLERFLADFNPKVCYLPTGVDTQFFKPIPACPSDKRIIISWIGTLHKAEYIENIEFALSCFNILRKQYAHIYFEIVGEGIHREALLQAINRYNDANIIFKGWINPDNMPAYLAGIHIGVLPVVSDNKFNNAKSPTKLFEYMAMAKPTVSSQIGENVHIIRDGDNGFLAKTSGEFTQKIQRLIEDGNLRQQIGAMARQAVETDYSLSVIGRRLYAALKELGHE